MQRCRQVWQHLVNSHATHNQSLTEYKCVQQWWHTQQATNRSAVLCFMPTAAVSVHGCTRLFTTFGCLSCCCVCSWVHKALLYLHLFELLLCLYRVEHVLPCTRLFYLHLYAIASCGTIQEHVGPYVTCMSHETYNICAISTCTSSAAVVSLCLA